MKIIPIPKPELSETDKIKETAHQYRQGLWLSYHKRKTEEYHIDNFHSYMLKMVNEWEAKYLKKNGLCDGHVIKIGKEKRIKETAERFGKDFTIMYHSANSKEEHLAEFHLFMIKCINEWESSQLKKLDNEPG
ncbi:MAG: hypothetical protein LCH91_13735 [Bacteroidetes bacterium]|nr:hypothetical protein [Bacteroidota bacterium]